MHARMSATIASVSTRWRSRSTRVPPAPPPPALPIQLRRDDVQASEHRHHVAQRVAADQVREQGEVNERRRAAAGPVGHVAAVADEVEAELAVGRFDRRVRSLRSARRSRGCSSPVRSAGSALRCVGYTSRLRPAGPSARRRSTLTGPAGRFSSACAHDLQALAHLLHADAGSGRSNRPPCAARPGNRSPCTRGTARPCAGRGSRRWRGRPGPVALRLVASSFVSTPTPLVRSTKMRLRFSSRSMSSSVLGNVCTNVADLLDRQRRDVVHHAADAGVAGGEARRRRASRRCRRSLLALIERVQEERERAQCRGHRADAQQVVADAGQLGQMIVRMYLQRGVSSMPSSFSTAWCHATLLAIGEM